MHVGSTIRRLSKQRPLPKRPRLGNTWQNHDWRRKLISGTRYKSLASLFNGRHASSTIDGSNHPEFSH